MAGAGGLAEGRRPVAAAGCVGAGAVLGPAGRPRYAALQPGRVRWLVGPVRGCTSHGACTLDEVRTVG